jgi:hypothetical protein
MGRVSWQPLPSCPAASSVGPVLELDQGEEQGRAGLSAVSKACEMTEANKAWTGDDFKRLKAEMLVHRDVDRAARALGRRGRKSRKWRQTFVPGSKARHWRRGRNLVQLGTSCLGSDALV